MSEIVIDIKNLKVQYPDTDVPALNGINLSVEKGEFVGILGAHGAGKTTLCLSINGIVPNMITADMYGSIVVAGEVPPNIPVRELATKVGSVFDNPEFQMSQLTVFEEVALGLQNLGVDKEIILSNIGRALEMVGLKGFEERSPFEISGGQQHLLPQELPGATPPRRDQCLNRRILFCFCQTCLTDPKEGGMVRLTLLVACP